MFDISSDMTTCLGIAISFAPFDTGNLRYNAIKAELTPNGFRIRYSLADAFYVYFLEEGTSKSTKHVGFIANKTLPHMAAFLFNKYEENNQNKLNRINALSRFSLKDNRDRLFIREKRHNLSLNTDIDKIAREYSWEHDNEKDVYNEKWKELW